MNGLNGHILGTKPKHVLIIVDPPKEPRPDLMPGLLDMRRMLQVRGFDPVVWFWPIPDGVRVCGLDHLQPADVATIKRLIEETMPKLPVEVEAAPI